jgi:hypothetical protein
MSGTDRSLLLLLLLLLLGSSGSKLYTRAFSHSACQLVNFAPLLLTTS